MVFALWHLKIQGKRQGRKQLTLDILRNPRAKKSKARVFQKEDA